MASSTASEVVLIFTTQLYHCFSLFFLFALFSDEPEVFLPIDTPQKQYFMLLTSGG